MPEMTLPARGRQMECPRNHHFAVAPLKEVAA